MADIFREVDEDLRAERLQKFWKRYSSLVLAAAVLIVAATAAGVIWRERQAGQLMQQGVALTSALNLATQGNQDEAARILDGLALDGAKGYPVLAKLRHASLDADRGKLDEALAQFDAIANDKSIDAEYRDLAVIRAGYWRVDREDRAQIEQRMQPLMGSAWRFSARELVALAQLKAGDKAAAKTSYAALADDPATPASLRARATEMLAAIGG